MWKCPKCGTDNWDRSSYCHKCDRSLYVQEVRKQHGIRHQHAFRQQPQGVDDPEKIGREVRKLQGVFRVLLGLWDKRQKVKAGVTVKQHVREGKVIKKHIRKWPDS
jgi:uncharacterized OB-fold protein